MHRALLSELAGRGDFTAPIGAIRPLVEPGKTISVADAPSRSLIVGLEGRPVSVLFVSNKVDASYVACNVYNASAAKRLLGEDLGSVILEPLCQGDFRGLSFALWPWHKPLTSVRGLAYLQRQMVLPRMLRWLGAATRRTAREASSEDCRLLFQRPLEQIARDARMPPEAASLAERALRRLASGAWSPRVVLQHKDFGYWNVLLPHGAARRRFTRGFILIDWAGANMQGYPFVNLLMLGRSCRLRGPLLQKEVSRHANILSCDAEDVVSYLLAALGHVGMHLGHFAEDDYVALCRNSIAFSSAVAGRLR
jgi:hypothetical protein